MSILKTLYWALIPQNKLTKCVTILSLLLIIVCSIVIGFSKSPNNKKQSANKKHQVDGTWSKWTDWSTCDASCNNGKRQRSRICPRLSHRNCVGMSIEHEWCSLPRCSVDGVWSTWTNWTNCDVTCGNGTRRRSRDCTRPLLGGKSCVGNSSQTKSCGQTSCPIDGVWSTWTKWTNWNVTRGSGTRRRLRNCTEPQHGGKSCVGNAAQLEYCHQTSCPIDGVWSTWTNWTNCDVMCGNGTRRRSRNCTGPSHEGKPCVGNSSQTQYCRQTTCPMALVIQGLKISSKRQCRNVRGNTYLCRIPKLLPGWKTFEYMRRHLQPFVGGEIVKITQWFCRSGEKKFFISYSGTQKATNYISTDGETMESMCNVLTPSSKEPYFVMNNGISMLILYARPY